MHAPSLRFPSNQRSRTVAPDVFAHEAQIEVVMRRAHSRTALRYSLAILLTAAALLLRWPLWPMLENHLPFITFFPAVILSGFLGGLGPGLLATLLSAGAAEYFLFEPTQSLAVGLSHDLVGLLIFILVGAFISGLCEKIRSLNEGLLQRVRERTAELSRANEALLVEVAQRQRAEVGLQLQIQSARALQLTAEGMPAPDYPV